ncbi:MAG: diguanylate cyclase [Bacteroidota bacterium]
MSDLALDLLHRLNTPVWVVLPDEQEILFANRSAREMTGSLQITEMRRGSASAHAQETLTAYIPALMANEQVVEVWSVQREGRRIPLSCRLSLLGLSGQPEAIMVEGLLSEWRQAPDVAEIQVATAAGQNTTERGFYEKLFETNTAPMLLIDPAADGRIVDVNRAATLFYGYSRDEFCRKHTWEINAMGRGILPIMQEIAKLPGGHKPLNFAHRLADGSLRDVQTYAGQLELDGKRMMLCIVHDITEQKRLENELAQAALRDPLTGLWNRRQFRNLLESARRQKRRFDLDFSLLILDVDHFKLINDQYGHDAGDELLRTLAKAFEQRVRETDDVCRWGGEEFVVLLPQTDVQSAVELAECLRETIEQIQHPFLPPITVSVGVAQYEAEESADSLFKRADEALYRAKAAGRNRVVAT